MRERDMKKKKKSNNLLFIEVKIGGFENSMTTKGKDTMRSVSIFQGKKKKKLIRVRFTFKVL